MRDNWVELARIDDPHGSICGFCGDDNDFADDCGWFYISPGGLQTKSRSCCKACWDAKPGMDHRARYGVGER